MFGREVAELPLVATNAASQGKVNYLLYLVYLNSSNHLKYFDIDNVHVFFKGYFQALFACIEGLLGELKIERLFLPAAHEAESLWTGKFGFMALDQDEVSKILKFAMKHDLLLLLLVKQAIVLVADEFLYEFVPRDDV